MLSSGILFLITDNFELATSIMPTLLIINGTIGIGKTTVGRLVFGRLDNCAFLDGDAVWQIRPFEVTERTTAIPTRNIPFVLRSYFEAGYETVILCWIMHRQDIIDRILAPLVDLCLDVRIFTLVADEDVAVARVLARDGDTRDPEAVLLRLRQSMELDSTRIDTTHLQPDEVADAIISSLCTGNYRL